MAAQLEPDEINALMTAIDEGKVTAQRTEPTAVAPYDLTSQDRIIRGQMPTLDAISEQTASLLAIGLSGRTRMSLEIASSSAVLQKFSDLAPAMAPPNVLAILTLGQGHGCGLLVLEPPLHEVLLAAALGERTGPGQDEGREPRDGLTAVEQQVLKRLLTVMTDAMRSAWAETLPLKPEILRFETDPRLAAIAPPSEVGISVIFDVSGAINGRLRLLIPYTAVEAAKARLGSSPRTAGDGDQRFAKALATELQDVEVELRGILGLASLRFQKLLDLTVGDVIVLTADEHTPIPVLVEGRRKLSGLPRVSNGSMALEVRTPVSTHPS